MKEDKIKIKLNLSEATSLIKCLKEEIDVNNRFLSVCDFSDDEDLIHWDEVNNYNKDLKLIKGKVKEKLDAKN